MTQRISRLLFYLLLVLLPTQLGKHFFFPFSNVRGIPVDYLAPTIYLTDIVIILMIVFFVLESWIQKRKLEVPPFLRASGVPIILLAGYLLITSVFSSEPLGALYKWLKCMEYLGLVVVVARIQPPFSRIIFALSVGGFYTSILAIWQFIIQHSVGGWWWFLGERTFYASTPGIAAFPYNGQLFLRAYATFSHPNVLAGFFVIINLLMIPYIVHTISFFPRLLKGWYIGIVLLNTVGLILTFSRGAWIVYGIGLGILILGKVHKSYQKPLLFTSRLLVVLYAGIVLSFFIPQFITSSDRTVTERKILLNGAVRLTLQNPLIGVGLNQFIPRVQPLLPQDVGIFRFQPVHNSYLLIGVETGYIGCILFLGVILGLIKRGLKSSFYLVVPVLALYLIGMFDHYLVTLQQGQILLAVVLSLAFLPQKTYTDRKPKYKTHKSK